MMRREDDCVIKVPLSMMMATRKPIGRLMLRWINNISSHMEENNTSFKYVLRTERYGKSYVALGFVDLERAFHTYGNGKMDGSARRRSRDGGNNA